MFLLLLLFYFIFIVFLYLCNFIIHFIYLFILYLFYYLFIFIFFLTNAIKAKLAGAIAGHHCLPAHHLRPFSSCLSPPIQTRDCLFCHTHLPLPLNLPTITPFSTSSPCTQPSSNSGYCPIIL